MRTISRKEEAMGKRRKKKNNNERLSLWAACSAIPSARRRYSPGGVSAGRVKRKLCLRRIAQTNPSGSAHDELASVLAA